MHAGLTNQTLDAHRLIGHTLGIRIGIVQLPELTRFGIAFRGRIEDIMQRDVLAARLRRWQRLGHALAHGKVEAHDACGILQGLLGFDGAVDHALRHLVTTVFLADIVEYAAAAVRIEIHVDIRQGDSLRIEEAFENQTVLDRVEFGDAHGVCHHGACSGTTAGPHHHTVRLGPVDVVGHDKEVTAELHLAYYAAFVVGLLEHLDRRIAVISLFQALFDLLQEQRGLVPSFRTVELRHEGAILMIVEHHVAAFGDLQRIVACLGKVLEQFTHLFGGFQVVAGTVELESSRLVEGGAGVDAQHGVLRAGILRTHVMGIVGRQQRRIELFGDVKQPVGHLSFDIQPVVHEFDVEVVSAEDVLQLPRRT